MIAKICTFLGIHISGNVGVLDTERVYDIFVVGRKGGKIRDKVQHDIYTLNQKDPDRIMTGMNHDNEIRKKNSYLVSGIPS